MAVEEIQTRNLIRAFFLSEAETFQLSIAVLSSADVECNLSHNFIASSYSDYGYSIKNGFYKGNLAG